MSRRAIAICSPLVAATAPRSSLKLIWVKVRATTTTARMKIPMLRTTSRLRPILRRTSFLFFTLSGITALRSVLLNVRGGRSASALAVSLGPGRAKNFPLVPP